MEKQTELGWVRKLINPLQERLSKFYDNIYVSDQKKLSYAYEIKSYFDDDSTPSCNSARYTTDILLYERLKENEWRPRIVVEAKLGSVTTHDAITYSQKANNHKSVHPYLRYGILLGGFGGSLPGRLYRHGAFFDFMMAIDGEILNKKEMDRLVDAIRDEVEASRRLEVILFQTRARGREKFTFLHRKLILEGSE